MSSNVSGEIDHLSLNAPLTHSVEVFCAGSHITGTLRSGRPRVSDHLEAAEHVIEIGHADLQPGAGAIPLMERSSVFVNEPSVLFVLDLTPNEWASGATDAVHSTDPHDVLVSVSNFWISGQVNLPAEGDPQRFLDRSTRKFVPVTNADILHYDEQTLRTVLVNRDLLEAVVKRSHPET